MKTILSGLFLLISLSVSATEHRVKYDPNRNSFDDLKSAQTEAQKYKKLVLLEFGGEWCVWCHRLDQFLDENKDISKDLNEIFVIQKVNVSKENKNEEFLSQFSKIPGYPHLIVVSTEGKEIAPIDTSSLELEKSYSKENFQKLIKIWKDKKIN